MNKIYKICFLLLMIVTIRKASIAQGNPESSKTPNFIVIPKAPQAPVLDEHQCKEIENKVEKSLEKLCIEFSDLNLASVDLDKKIQKLNIKLKDINIPEMPIIPELPLVNFYQEVMPCTEPIDAVQKVKKISKSFPADANDVLYINNSYGKIQVNTWSKKEIKVDIEVRAFAGNDDDAQKLLESVNISSIKADNQISFKTEIDKNNRSNRWFPANFWGSDHDDKQKLEVFYNVYMPAKNSINFKTNYTNIIIPDMQGNVSLQMNYGDARAGEISGKTTVNSNYGKLTFGTLEDAIFTANYGSIKIAASNNITANLNYCAAELGKLNNLATIKLNYSGGFKINTFDKNFKALNINANYSSVNLGFNGSEAFNFDVTTNYSSFKYNTDVVTVTHKTPDDEQKGFLSTKNYKGYYGKSPASSVLIRSNYGGVKFD